METGEQVFWEAPITHFPQEPIFVPRPEATAEDDGILLIGGFNSETALGKNKVRKEFLISKYLLNATTGHGNFKQFCLDEIDKILFIIEMF